MRNDTKTFDKKCETRNDTKTNVQIAKIVSASPYTHAQNPPQYGSFTKRRTRSAERVAEEVPSTPHHRLARSASVTPPPLPPLRNPPAGSGPVRPHRPSPMCTVSPPEAENIQKRGEAHIIYLHYGFNYYYYVLPSDKGAAHIPIVYPQQKLKT